MTHRLVNQPIALKNRGNSCFINSIEQCFRAIEQHFQTGWSREIVNDKFKDFRQHDVHEYLLFILDHIEKGLNKKVFNSFFQGQYTTKVTFPCEHVNKHNEAFRVLSVACVPTMEEMIATLESHDHVSSECDTCQFKGSAVKKMHVSSVPKIVTFHIKRFNQFQKKHDKIDVPLSWNYLREDQNFVCTCFIIHYGNLIGGHYIACCRYGDVWWMCNDTNILPIKSIEEMLPHAYLIFYTKV